ncbi:Uncharacterised protein [Actinomyces bovis]|uniref:Uncharacterized protein n=1 Tax=Actinomyces bovis TaxID=1658 RepID=A0ABY1VS25_9ACTO|nr:Uncharacterised protein [Actinomyces bovis]VEG56541.1 Uncharacterised protein [Actinomyces israelii]
MANYGNGNSKLRDALKARPVELVIMIVSVLLGLVFMVVGLPPVGGVCFLIAFICALTIVVKTVSEKRDEGSIL